MPAEDVQSEHYIALPLTLFPAVGINTRPLMKRTGRDDAILAKFESVARGARTIELCIELDVSWGVHFR